MSGVARRKGEGGEERQGRRKEPKHIHTRAWSKVSWSAQAFTAAIACIPLHCSAPFLPGSTFVWAEFWHCSGEFCRLKGTYLVHLRLGTLTHWGKVHILNQGIKKEWTGGILFSQELIIDSQKASSNQSIYRYQWYRCIFTFIPENQLRSQKFSLKVFFPYSFMPPP